MKSSWKLTKKWSNLDSHWLEPYSSFSSQSSLVGFWCGNSSWGNSDSFANFWVLKKEIKKQHPLVTITRKLQRIVVKSVGTKLQTKSWKTQIRRKTINPPFSAQTDLGMILKPSSNIRIPTQILGVVLVNWTKEYSSLPCLEPHKIPKVLLTNLKLPIWMMLGQSLQVKVIREKVTLDSKWFSLLHKKP